METINSQVYMVTDVTSRLGQAIATGLARTGGTVILVAPDDERGAQVASDVSAAAQNPKVDLHLSDLSNLSSVRNLAGILKSKYAKIDVLANNYSVYTKQRQISVDGFEKMFAANHLGPFLLTNLLLDLLQSSEAARIITITAPSNTELMFDDLQSERRFNSRHILDMTRTANIRFTHELARRLENTNVTVNAIDPGLVRTEIQKEAPAWIRSFAWLFARRPEQAAEEIVSLATDPSFAGTRGKFFRKGQEIDFPPYVHDPGIQQNLWQVSERLTDASQKGPNYDPTGSVAMHNKREIPEEILRPEDRQVEKESGVVSDK